MGENTGNNQEKEIGFGSFAAVRMLVWTVAAVAVIAGLVFVLRFFESPEATRTAGSDAVYHESGPATAAGQEPDFQAMDVDPAGAGHKDDTREAADSEMTYGTLADTAHKVQAQPSNHDTEFSAGTVVTQKEVPTRRAKPAQPSKPEKAIPPHTAAPAQERLAEAPHGADGEERKTFPALGMAFVDAVIQPLDYELNHRFYGWRPNDIINVTDNVNNFQLGVLEVTRRSAVILAERISRTGSTAAFDKNLENAMNWFMITADRYWFPAAETKYREGLNELRVYFNNLRDGNAAFYTRTDNLIPLLAAYEDLLGSCDENLVKQKEKDGSAVSTFKADDYFYYAQGVASSMLTILEAIQEEFNIMVTREGGMEVLRHAIESCHHAAEIDPWIIFNSDPSSIFANHRSNIAAPISHARFYLGVLIKALST
jgi:hypothetical protein